MEDIKQIIAKNIASLRTDSKLTQLELAEKLNYSDKAISKWERGESIPDVITLKAVADLFGVTVDYLLTGRASGQDQQMARGAMEMALQEAQIRLEKRKKQPLSREELAVIFAALLLDT